MPENRTPAGLLPLAGWTVVERQARLAARAGAEHLVICADRASPELNSALARLRGEGINPEIARHVAEAGDLIQPDCVVVEFAEGLEIGRAHVGTPVTNAHLVCRLLLEKNTQTEPR